MKLIGILILVFLPLFCQASQYAPLLSELPGFTKGQATANIQIQIVYDPVCDDSSAFDRTTWKQTEQQILAHQQLKTAVKFRYIPFALPYHITAQKIVQALIYVKQQSNSQALQLLRYFLENLEQFNDEGCKYLSSDQIIDKIASIISSQKGYPKTQLIKSMQHTSDYDGKTRKWAKFVIGQMSLAGTPSLFINWVQVDKGTTMQSKDWISLLQSLIKKQRVLLSSN